MMFKWDGEVMRPFASGAAMIAQKTFTSGHAYNLIVAAERSNARSLEQNAKLWAMLGEIAEQKEHCGRKYSAEQWKSLFMHACGAEISFLPSLDNKTFIPWGMQSSSKLTKEQMGELLEFIQAWCAQNDVNLRDDPA